MRNDAEENFMLGNEGTWDAARQQGQEREKKKGMRIHDSLYSLPTETETGRTGTDAFCPDSPELTLSLRKVILSLPVI